METLLVIIDELLYEKRQLEKEKVKNLEKIKICEKKIAYYINLCRESNALSLVYQNQIDSYQRMIDRDENWFKIFNIKLLEDYSEKRIEELRDKKRKTVKKKNVASECTTYYQRRLEDLTARNEEIDNRLSDIAGALDKVYLRDEDYEEKKLERRNKNDRHKIN